MGDEARARMRSVISASTPSRQENRPLSQVSCRPRATDHTPRFVSVKSARRLARSPATAYHLGVGKPLTDREWIRQLLEDGTHDLDSLAQLLETKLTTVEQEVAHAVRSSGKKLRITPAECEACGFVFRARTRLSSPSRCPSCRSERVTAPRFTLR